MKLLLVNTSANTGSTGIIAEEIGLQAQQSGYEVAFAYGRQAINSRLPTWQIGKKIDYLWHGVETRLLDNHGFASRQATKAFIKKLADWKPDIVNLHNLHGYYLNVAVLFDYLKERQIPVVWTFHDCWPFTGHCCYFDRYNCYKWQTGCHRCPAKHAYPVSWGLNRSGANFKRKKSIFNGLKNMTIVTPSQWLSNHVAYSFLKDYPVKVINNGVDLTVFKPTKGKQVLNKYQIPNKPYIIGVAGLWDDRKGLSTFIALRKRLSAEIPIVLVGLSKEQAAQLSDGIIAVPRTENRTELAALYAQAAVFVNPTKVDNFPTVNIEALACGTPVVTYQTGGSPEAVDEDTGIVVEKGNVDGLEKAIQEIFQNGKSNYEENCKARAVKFYNKEERFGDYVRLFEKMLR